jgi:hypothetical protein
MGTLNMVGFDTIETSSKIDEADPMNLLRIFYSIESSIPQGHQKEDHETRLHNKLRELPRDSLVQLISGPGVELEKLLLALIKAPAAQRLEDEIQLAEAQNQEQQKSLEKKISETTNVPMAQNKVKEELHQLELLDTTRGVEDGNPQLEERFVVLRR